MRMGHSTAMRSATAASKAMRRSVALVAATVIAGMIMALGGCSATNGSGGMFGGTGNNASSAKTQSFTPAKGKAMATLRIASGSENKEVADAIQQAVDSSKVAVTLDYMGSLDIMTTLNGGGGDYDAVWPASSIWISMGDTKHIVKEQQSTSTTPIVFGIAKSKAVSLGWASGDGTTTPVSTADLIKAVKSGDLTFSMTSATQSNSGASAYLAFLTALSGKNQALTADDLNDATLQDSVKTLLSGVDRSSGSSDWLKDMVVADPGRFDAMVNYESLVIAADKQLTADGKDPLLAVYPSDGIAVSDSPLGYVDRGQAQSVSDAYGAFAKALESKDCKLLFERAGRRTGLGGTLAYSSDHAVQQAFRAEWDITTGSDALKAIPMPAASVISQALNIYQHNLRKPSWTVWVVDYSGSMSGDGKDGVVRGLNAALDKTEATASMIEPGDGDVNILIPFNQTAMTPVRADGTDTAALLDHAEELAADGGTNIYDGLNAALSANMPSDPGRYTTAIVLMTDGQSETADRSSFQDRYRSEERRVPIFPIMFGDADPDQLKDIASLSNAKVFDGRSGDLAAVFRQVKGYN